LKTGESQLKNGSPALIKASCKDLCYIHQSRDYKLDQVLKNAIAAPQFEEGIYIKQPNYIDRHVIEIIVRKK